MGKPSATEATTKPPVAPADAIEPLMTIDGLARVLACNRRTVERLRAAGRLPRPDVMIGRRAPRWSHMTIRAWIEKGGRP